MDKNQVAIVVGETQTERVLTSRGLHFPLQKSTTAPALEFSNVLSNSNTKYMNQGSIQLFLNFCRM